MVNRNRNGYISYGMIIFFVLFSLLNCNSEEKDQKTLNNSLKLKMEWTRANTNELESLPGYYEKNICDDYGIETIAVTVHNANGDLIEQDNWVCSNHTGSVKNIPTGPGYEVAAMAYVDGRLDWQAVTKDVLVKEGNTIVDLQMSYVGKDTSPPIVLVNSSYPYPMATNVPIDTSVKITFSKSLMHSSIGEASFYIQESLTDVKGIISHPPMSSSITFDPMNDLKYDTEYTVTLLTHILDYTNQTLTENFEFSFRTIPYDPHLPPETPQRVKAIPQDSKVILSWDAVPHTTQYTVYYDFYPDVSKEMHLNYQITKENGVHCQGLFNKELYYFTVIAQNQYGESNYSDIVSATPVMLPVTNDVIAYFDFKNGNAFDQSHNGNSGIVFGAKPTSDKAGNENHALLFDGRNDYIEVMNPRRFNLLEYTIVVVFKIDSAVRKSKLLAKGYQFYNYAISIQGKKHGDSGKATFKHHTTLKGVKQHFQSVIDTKPIPHGEFQHMVVTLQKMADGPHYSFNTYRNGILTNAESSVPKPMTIANHPLIIGAGGDDPRIYFKGVIDDVIIYKRALTHEEIIRLYEFSGVKPESFSEGCNATHLNPSSNCPNLKYR